MATKPDPAALRVLIFANPRAGARSSQGAVLAIQARLRAAGYKVQILSDVEELATKAAEGHAQGQLRAVVVAGGDGTASLVRNQTPLEVPLLPLPLGTENLLAQYLSQASDPDAVVQTLTAGVPIGLDLGRVGDRFFLLMFSAGFDAEIVRRLHQNRQGNITRASYIGPALQAIRHYEYPEIEYHESTRTSSGDKAEPSRCRWIFGMNLPLYARGVQLAPEANGSDGLLDLCTFDRGSLVNAMRYLWNVTRGSHLRLQDVRLTKGRQFHIKAVGDEEVAYQLDGDPGGVLPIDVEVLPGQLRLMVAPQVAQRLNVS